MLKPTVIKDFPGRAVDHHLKDTGVLPNETKRDIIMQPHQQRVVDEKKELDERLDKLKAFIETNSTFKSLPDDERGRLNRQFDIMVEYSSILSQRIAAF